MSKVNPNALVGRSVEIVASDPWDVVTVIGTAPRRAIVLEATDKTMDIDSAALLIRMEHPFTYTEAEYQHFIATVRYEGDDVADLTRGKAIVFNLTAVSKEQTESPTPLGMSDWRGGLGLIATVKLLDA